MTNPTIDALWQQTSAFFQQGQFEKAMHGCQQVLSLNSNHVDAIFYQGVIVMQLGQFESAVRFFESVLSLNPDYPHAESNLGKSLMSLGRHEEANAVVESVVSKNPKSGMSWMMLGVIKTNLNLNNEAIVCTRKAIELNKNDVDAHQNLGQLLILQEDYEAAISNMTRSLEIFPQNKPIHNAIATAHFQLQQYDQAAAVYRQICEIDHGDLTAKSNLGSALAKAKKYADALIVFDEVLDVEPENATALSGRSWMLYRTQRLTESINGFRQAIELGDDDREAWLGLSNALSSMGQFGESQNILEKIFAEDPSDVGITNDFGVCMYHQLKHEEAIHWFEKALEMDPGRVEAEMGIAIAHLRMGRFSEGWKTFHTQPPDDTSPTHGMAGKRWGKQPLQGKRILFCGEQGIGDILQFVRYTRNLKQMGATVIVACRKQVHGLLEPSPWIDELTTMPPQPAKYDFFIEMTRLPGLFDTQVDTVPAEVPYIHAREDLAEYWREKIGNDAKIKIGINWQGSRSYGEDYLRSIPLKHFEILADIPGVQLFSLQQGYGEEQIKDARFPITVIGDTDGPATGPFLDTAAIMKCMDLIITSDTSAAHLAGALGIPVWVGLKTSPDWRWLLDRNDCPWYPTMKLFRQQSVNDWTGVFNRMKAELLS